jgi:glycosyltransferase involved in cell wall biosynthesis
MNLPSQTQIKVTILLAVYNGGEELQSQLDSYLQQSLPPSTILISDDGSQDGSQNCLAAFSSAAQSNGIACHLLDGPGCGGTANFLNLLRQASPDSDYVALSDQDDIWLPAKLAEAVQALASHADHPALFGSRSWEWNSTTDRRHLSRPVPAPHDFRHALVQNFAGGNTMVLNRAALRLVQRALPRIQDAAVHDWWLYQLITGAGGTVVLSQTPQILYRQHSENQIGANRGLRSKLRRFRAMLGGSYQQWNDLNVAALEPNKDLLTPEAREILTHFARDRHRPLLTRLNMLRHTGLRRKGAINQATLWLAAALNKL